MYVHGMTQNNLSYYDANLKIGYFMYNYHDFYIKSQNYRVNVGCIGGSVVTGLVGAVGSKENTMGCIKWVYKRTEEGKTMHGRAGKKARPQTHIHTCIIRYVHFCRSQKSGRGAKNIHRG